jgi:hypothetical protein
MTDFIKEWAKGHGPDVVAEMLCDLDEVIKKCEMYNDINSTMKGIPYFDSINRFKSCSWDRVFCPECNEGNWIFIGTPVFGDPRGEQTPWGCRCRGCKEIITWSPILKHELIANQFPEGLAAPFGFKEKEYEDEDEEDEES